MSPTKIYKAEICLEILIPWIHVGLFLPWGKVNDMITFHALDVLVGGRKQKDFGGLKDRSMQLWVVYYSNRLGNEFIVTYYVIKIDE